MAQTRSLRVRKHRVNYTYELNEDDDDDKHEETKEATRSALKLFNDFCDEVDISVQFTSKNIPTLAHALKRLYCGAKTQKYQLYDVSAFRSLRSELKRHFQEKLKVNIIKDKEFAEANKAFTDRETRIKAAGEGLIRVFAPVQENDLKLLKKYFKKNMQNPTPQQLLEYVWFILQYYKRQIRTESYDNLKVTRFIIRTNAKGKKCILPNECEQDLSPHRNTGGKSVVSSSVIPAMNGDVLCPVKAFKLYKSKIHKDLNRLFQKPKKHVDQSQSLWFDRVPFGSSLNEMMATLSANANLSMKYTNQSLTAANIAKLIWDGIKRKAIPSGGDNTTTVRQVTMRSPLSMTIVKKNKRGRLKKPETTLINEDDNNAAKSLKQKKSTLKTGSSMATPPPVINMTQESQQQGVKLTLKKSAPCVSSANNNRPCVPVAAPSHRQDPLPPKQTPSKSLTSFSSISNNQESEILTSNKTQLCRMPQSITNRDERSAVNGQNLLQSRTDEETPSPENGQHVVTSRTDEVLQDGNRENHSSENGQNAPKSITDEVLRSGYQETPSSENGQNVRKSGIDEVLRGGYQETPSSENGQNVRKSGIDEVLRGGYQETPSSENEQNVHKPRTDDVVFVDKYRVRPSRSTFNVMGVPSCGGLFTDRNVSKMMIQPIETSTHSYVIHQHQTSMLANMAELWKKGKFCDSTIGNGTMKIMVHKIVLVALCPQLLNSSNSDLTSECFQFTFPQEIGGDALWAFSKYMYEGVISITSDVLEDIEQISVILNLQDLKDMCNLYRNQVNLLSNTSLSSQSLAANNLTTTDTPINLDPLPPFIKSEASVSGPPSIRSEPSVSGPPSIRSEPSVSGPPSIRSEPSVSGPPSIRSEPSVSGPPSIRSEPSVSGPPSIRSEPSVSGPPSIRSEPSVSGPPSIRSEPSVSGPPSIRSEPSASGPPSIRSEPSASGPPSIRSEPSASGPPFIRSEPSASGPPFIRSEPSVNGPPSIRSEPLASGPPFIKSELSASEPPFIRSEASASGPPFIRSEASASGPPSIRSEASASGPPFIKSELSASGPPFIKSELSASRATFHSPPSGDITQTVSRPVQHLQVLTAESNHPRLQYSSNQSSISNMNQASDDQLSITISESDSDSDLIIISSNITLNPVRKRKRQHLENNFLLSKQSPSESFLNDPLPEICPYHSHGRNDNLTNPSPSKQIRLTDNLTIDDSQNLKISYSSSKQRSNDIPYSIIGNSDDSF